ncbi:MAG: hypothetical protein IJB71_01875 [Bacilli bacterium]|nr:hypothetical protein [Bacilli bacterium]
MSLIILLVILIVILFVCRNFASFLYAFAISDILLRIIAFVNSQIAVASVNNVLSKLPNSIESMIANDSDGIIYTVLMWIYVGLYAIFISYLIPTFFRKRKHR